MASTSNLGVGLILEFDGTEEYRDYPVDASATIYEGDYVGVNSGTGYARKLTAGDTFLGLAVREVLNSGSGFDPNRSGTGAAGTTFVRVLVRGKQKVSSITDGAVSLSANAKDVGITIAASDDRTLNTTTGGNSTVGKIAGIDQDGKYVVALEGAAVRSI